MRTVFFAIAFAISVTINFASPAQAEEPAIQDVITSQIEAFQVDDFVTAFTYASPTIQNLFGTADNFGRMVSQGYPMVWRPAGVTYLSQRIEGAVVFQDVKIVDAAGNTHLVEYTMERLENEWRISGVRILEAPGASV
ncbi:MAG: DUF4864 domain-containing protein [Aliishimia sp.]